MSTLRFKRSEVLELLKKLKADDEVMLVGDQGVYLMSFADPVEGRTIVYAEGCNPNTDVDFYDNKEAIFGGDDGGDTIGTASDLFKLIWPGKKYLLVKMTSKYMQLGRQ